MSDVIVWTAGIVEPAEVVEITTRLKLRLTSNRLDCRPEFIDAMNKAIYVGNEGFIPTGFHIEAPFLHRTKADIVGLGLLHKVPYQYTWTCYKGEALACGVCGTCVERLEAFSLAGAIDPLDYKDREGWREQITKYQASQQS